MGTEQHSIQNGNGTNGSYGLPEVAHQLETLARNCEVNYQNGHDKEAALLYTKDCAVRALGEVAHHIRTLSVNLFTILNVQTQKVNELDSSIKLMKLNLKGNDELLARKHIGQYVVQKKTLQVNYTKYPGVTITGTTEEIPKYTRKPIDYSSLDHVGHSVKVVESTMPHLATLPRGRGAIPHPATMDNASVSGASMIYDTQRGLAGRMTATIGPKMGGEYSASLMATANAANRQQGPPSTRGLYSGLYGGQIAGGGPTGMMPQQMSATPPGAIYATGPGGPSNLAQRSDSISSANQHYHDVNTIMMHPSQMGNLPGGLPATAISPPTQMSQQKGPRRASSGSTSSSGQYGQPMQRPPNMPAGYPQYGQQPPGVMRQVSGAGLMKVGMPDNLPPPPPPATNMGGWSGREAAFVINDLPPPPPPPQIPNENEYIPPPPPMPMGGMPVPDQGYNSSYLSAADYPQMDQNILESQDLRPRTAYDPSWAPNEYIHKVQALYEYKRNKYDELSFQEGTIIYVIQKNEDGWWEGIMENERGLFPHNYVGLI